jgi:DNA-binding MarR family transcriptional regulator
MAQGDRFAELLARVAREVTIRQASDVCCGDLTLEQFQTLRAVSTSEPVSIGSLSALLRVDLSTMSRNVALLERNAYVMRERSADDGRIVLVKLTAKGKRALHTLQCGERDVLGDVFDRLPPAQRPRVLEALESLSACLTETEAAAGAACCAPVTIRRTTTP